MIAVVREVLRRGFKREKSQEIFRVEKNPWDYSSLGLP